jgi:hypothetical protein
VQIRTLVSARHHTVCLACSGLFYRRPHSTYWTFHSSCLFLDGLILGCARLWMLNCLYAKTFSSLVRCSYTCVALGLKYESLANMLARGFWRQRNGESG